MSVPTSDWIPIAVLAASLAGSLHCVTMCGGLVAAVARTPGELVRYHLGRLLGYTTLGAVAGWIGEAFLSSWWVTLALAFALFWIGLRIWQGKGAHGLPLPQRMVAWAFRPGAAFAAGIGTALIPCGWLHAFVLGAVATQSPARGAIYIAFFWLGTLPALSALSFAAKTAIRPLGRYAPKLAAILLIASGAMSLGWRLSIAQQRSSEPVQSSSSCHEH